jgi:hypothetical protein
MDMIGYVNMTMTFNNRLSDRRCGEIEWKR